MLAESAHAVTMPITTASSADKLGVRDFSRLAAYVDALPAYVEVVVSGLRNGEQLDIVLLTRDISREDRRLTSLTYGTECFGFIGYLDGCRYTFDDGVFVVSFNFECRGFSHLDNGR